MDRIAFLLNHTPDDILNMPYSAYFEELTTLIIYHPELLTRRLIHQFIRQFPMYHFLLPYAVQEEPVIARAIIRASQGRVFLTLPARLRSNLALATLAWRLNPMGGYAIHFKLRRTIATDAFVERLMQYPTTRRSCVCLKYIPRAALRKYARNALQARAAFLMFLRASPLPAVVNAYVASFIPIEVERPTLHWLAKLRRYAV
jgi:hypothetical protein